MYNEDIKLGMYNTGELNVGDHNSGDNNSGWRNSGDNNSGHRNSGDNNSGDGNTGQYNQGDFNSGGNNSGDSNTGYNNSGSWNSGFFNLGDCNSGLGNIGDWNSGNWNSGNYNSGQYNSGNWSTGIFCTEENPKIKIFDVESNMTMREWMETDAANILGNKLDNNIWINTEDMTDEERKQYPSHEITGGYLKTLGFKESFQIMWAKLTDKEKEIIRSIPNFNTDKFTEITGIKIVK